MRDRERLPVLPAASWSSVDVAAGTVTIAHGAVDSLKWPPMTMTFKAPDIDLSAFKQGDQVAFEFSAEGMDGTISSITRN